MAGRQRPARSFPVDAQPDRRLADLMGFQRGQVVGYVIDQKQRRPCRLGQDAAGGLGEQLPVGAGVVRGGGHGTQVPAALRRGDRHAGQLPVGRGDAVTGHHLAHDLHLVAADLVPRPAGAAVDHGADLAFGQPERLRRRVENLLHRLDLLPDPKLPNWCRPRSAARLLTCAG